MQIGINAEIGEHRRGWGIRLGLEPVGLSELIRAGLALGLGIAPFLIGWWRGNQGQPIPFGLLLIVGLPILGLLLLLVPNAKVEKQQGFYLLNFKFSWLGYGMGLGLIGLVALLVGHLAADQLACWNGLSRAC